MGDSTQRQITLYDFLTDDEIAQAVELRDRKAVRDQIIVPNMERINAALGQENDADYLAYAVEYVMQASGRW
jgi:phosphatidylserine/phosphatidylglycerophosphate/cardiolipin synthase-like enzyme